MLLTVQCVNKDTGEVVFCSRKDYNLDTKNGHDKIVFLLDSFLRCIQQPKNKRDCFVFSVQSNLQLDELPLPF